MARQVEVETARIPGDSVQSGHADERTADGRDADLKVRVSSHILSGSCQRSKQHVGLWLPHYSPAQGWSPGQLNQQHPIETLTMRPRPGPAGSASQGWATCVCVCVCVCVLCVYECV